MKTISRFFLIFTLTATATSALSVLRESSTQIFQTNLPAGKTAMPVVKAEPYVKVELSEERKAELEKRSPSLLKTAQNITRIVPSEIRIENDGAIADFGLQKVYFPADVAESPVVIVTPDGRKLSCKATFLAIQDVVTGRNVQLGQVKSSIGQLVGTDTVLYPNAFDFVHADVRYRYTKYSLEQDIILHEDVRLPEGFDPENVRFEVWSEWLDSSPDDKEVQTIDLRPSEAAGDKEGNVAEDEQLKFGAARIGDGFAFSIQNESEKVPVAKQFIKIEGREWLIERADRKALKTQLEKLPKSQAAITPERIKTTREGLVRSLQAHRPSKSKSVIKRMARYSPSNKDSLVLDFVIVSAVPVPANCISWWPAGGNGQDAKGTNHGTLHNTTTYGGGKIGQGFVLDGFHNPDYIAVSNTASLNPTNAITIETWIYFTDDESYWNMPIVSKDSWTSRQYLLTKNGDDVIRGHVGITNGTFYYFDGQTQLQPFTWYHVAMTYSAAQSNLSVYVNGVLDASGSVSGSMISSTETLYIGGAPNWEYYWGGRIDEPAIYSRALSSNELQAIYDAGAAGKINPNCASVPTNIVAWWPGDDTRYDFARTNHVTLQNSAGYEAGMVGQGFSFDGYNQHARISDRAALRFTNAMTIETWIKPSNVDWYGQIVDRWDAAVGREQRSYTTGLLPGGQFFFLVSSNGTGPASYYVTTTNSVAPDSWAHVVGTYDGSKLRVYFNGVLEADGNYSSGIFGGTNDLAIGGVTGGYGWGSLISPFPGIIDEPTIYNRALSNSEVTALYTAGGAGKCKVDIDGDGLSNLQESFLGTNPNNTDSDGDGLTDGDEVFVHFTKPYDNDTDRDGLSDGQEISNSTNPLVANSPAIQVQPAPHSVAAAQSTSFTVTMTGNVITNYLFQWKSNSVAIAGQTNATMTIAKASSGHAAIYSVVVTNIAGSVTSSNATLTVTCMSTPSGLVGSWQGENNAYDGITNQHGYFVAGNYVAGKKNTAFQFDGTSSYVMFPDSAAQTQASFTIETWVYPTTFNTAWKTIVLKARGSSEHSFALYARSDTANAPRVEIYTSSGYKVATNSSALSLNAWSHIAATYDGSMLKLYVNGLLTASNTVNSPVVYSTGPLTIGGNKVFGSEYFTGTIDEVGLYSRALSASEIADIHLAGSLGKCPPSIRVIPQDLKILTGNNAAMRPVGVEGSAPTYQWKFNTTNIVSATNASLSLTNLQLTNSGNYGVSVQSGGTTNNSSQSVLVSSCFPAVDVVLVVDRSGSMVDPAGSGMTRLEAARTACSNFVQSLNLTNDKMSIATFEATASLNQTLTTNLATLLTKIGQITSPTGSTHMINGLLEAQLELVSQRHNSNAMPVLVFLTDGDPDDSTNAILNVAQQIKDFGTHIVTVGLGTNLMTNSLNLLKAMASKENHFYHATTTAQLTNIYNIIADSVCRSETNQPISVTIVSPTNGYSVVSRETVAIKAVATTGVTNTIRWVQFFETTNNVSSNSIGYATAISTNGYYNINWMPLYNGTYTLTARAFDSRGSNAISSPVIVNVRGRPDVTITNPINESVFGPSMFNVSISANAKAFGSNITITNVSYYNGASLIKSSTNSPSYTIIWSNVDKGIYTLKARATDSLGVSAYSYPIEFTVQQPNAAPVVNAGSDLTIHVGETRPLVGTIRDDGLPAGVVSAAWTMSSGTGTATFGNSSETETTIAFTQTGTKVLTLTGSDGVLNGSDTVTILVVANNSPPSVNAGPSQSITTGATRLSGYATDDGVPTNGKLSTVWRSIQGPGAVRFADYTVTNTSVSFEREGRYVFELSASDGELTTRSNVVVDVLFTPGSNAIPYQASGYRYMITNTDEVADFYLVNYDDTVPPWTNGQAGFGTIGATPPQCPMNNTNYVKTEWPDPSDLLLRKKFFIPPGTTNLSIGFTVDNDSQTYLNGTLIDSTAADFYWYAEYMLRDWRLESTPNGWYVHSGCPELDDLRIENLATNLWQEGTNLLAVRARNRLDNSPYPGFFDMRISFNSPAFITNRPPRVALGPNQFIHLSGYAPLRGLIFDPDVGPAGKGEARWEKISGPGNVAFAFSGVTNSNEFAIEYESVTNLFGFATFDQLGEYVIGLTAGHNMNDMTNYSEMLVSVITSNSPPVVTLTSTLASSIQMSDMTIPLIATAQAVSGTITNVEFLAKVADGDFIIGRTPNPPYEIQWSPGVWDNYLVTARAFDSNGRMGVSDPILIQIAPYTNGITFTNITYTNNIPYTNGIPLTNGVAFTNGNSSPKAITDYETVFAGSKNNLIYPLKNDTDPDGDTLTIIKVSPSEKGEIIGGKAIRYTPPSGQSGNKPGDGFSYQISDGRGGTSWGSILVYMYAGEVPEPLITYPPVDGYSTNAGKVMPLRATITNTPYVTKVEFFRNGALLGVTTNSVGGTNFTLNWVANAECDCPITAQATDIFGQVGTSPERFITITPPAGVSNPAALIELAIGTGETNVLNTTTLPTIREAVFDLYGRAFQVQNSNIVWRLGVYSTEGELLYDLTPPPYNADGQCTNHFGNASSSNKLATCVLTDLENGAYEFRLAVSAGYISTNVTVPFRLDSQLKIGQFSFSQQDLVIPVNGIPLTVIRTYNSMNPRQGDFGYSWTYAINDMDVELNEVRKPTPGWSDEGLDLKDELFSQRIGGGRDVTLTLPDGRRTTFYFSLRQGTIGQNYGEWTPPPGINATLKPIGNNILQAIVGALSGNEELYYWQAGGGYFTPIEAYDFLAFELETSDGTRYILSREDLGAYQILDGGDYSYVHAYGKPKLSQIIQRSGDTILVNLNSIQHFPPGASQPTRQVVFQRNEAGLISGISDPNGLDSSGNTNSPLAMQYQYDAKGNLTTVLQLVNRSTASYVTNTFTYGLAKFPHYITGIVDPRGITVARNDYDDEGRLTSLTDANGKVTRFYHNASGRVEIVTDRLGYTNSFVYDLRGNVTFTTNAIGVVSRRAYDSNNRETAVTNALGTAQETWSLHAYDQYGYQTNVITSPNRTNSFAYDGFGNLLWQRDVLGNVTTNGYDVSGNLTNTVQFDTNGVMVAKSSSLYVNGHLVETRNINNQVTAAFGYDATGNLTSTTDANGVSRGFGYDANGNQTNSYYAWTPPGGGATVYVTNRTEHDAQGRAVRTLDALGNTNRTFYNTLGKVDYTVDKFGNTNSFLYDTRGNLIQTTSADGLMTRTVYDDAGRAILTTDRNGLTGTRMYYDAAGRVTNSVRLVNVAVSIMAGPKSEITSAGTVVSSNRTEYFDSGWVKKRIGADNQPTTYAYWPDGQTMYVTNALGQTTFYKYDIAGRQDYVVDALNRTNRFGYDAAGRMAVTTFHDGSYTSNYFNSLGQRTVTRDQGGLLTQFGYDLSGQLTNVTKPQVIDGATGNPFTPAWTYKYDVYGRQTEEIDPRGKSTTNSYDAYGRAVSRWLPMGGEGTTNFYNSLGQLTNQIDFKGQQKQTRYDRFGRVTNVLYFDAGSGITHPSNTVHFYYNQLGQLTNITEKFGEDASSGYIAFGDVGDGVRGLGDGVGEKLLASLGRMPVQAQGGGLALLLFGGILACSSASRRLCGLIVRLVLEQGVYFQPQSHRVTEVRVDFDPLPSPIRQLPSPIYHLPFSWVVLLSTIFHHLSTLVRCGGTVTARERRLRLLPSYGWRFVTLITLAALIGSDPAFDGLWNARAACVAPASNTSTLTTRITTFTYDVEGRLAQVSSPEGWINYDYDVITGRHVGTCTQNSESTYEYDALGRLWKVHAIKRNGTTINETTTYTYTAVGSRDTVTLPNNTVTAYKYDELNRLTNLTHKASNNTVLASYSYKLHPTGRRTNAVEALLNPDDNTYVTNTTSWQYDGLYRLTNEVSTSTSSALAHATSYEYDKNGNRWKKIDVVGGTTTTVTNLYNANDQLLKEVTLVNGTANATNNYVYDANGSLTARTNITSGSTATALYDYDLKNKMSAVTTGGSTTKYEYNHQGIRVRTVTTGSTKYYLVDGNNHTGYAQVLEEMDTLGSTPARSYVLGDDVLAQCGTTTSDPAYLLYDGHGSTRQLVHSTVNVTEQYNYDAYGMSLTTLGTPETQMLYSGEQFDSTLGMYNNRARFYNPSNGRFNARDTFMGSNDDPQSLHKYAYAHSDPVNGIDPSGEFSLVEFAIVAVAVVVLLLIIIPPIARSPKIKAAGAIGRARPATPEQMEHIKNGIKKLLRATASDPVLSQKIRDMQGWVDGTRSNVGDVEAIEVLVLARSDVGAHNLANPYHLYIPNTFEEVNGQPASGGELRAAIAVFAEWQHDKTYSGGRGLSEQEAQVELEALVKAVQKRYKGFVFPFRHGGQ